jgi:hypothetical protein
MELRIQAEVLTLKKEKIYLKNRLMTIEAAYSKNGRPKRVRFILASSTHFTPGWTAFLWTAK